MEAASAIGGDRALAISTDSTGGTSRGSRIGAGRLFGRMRRLDTAGGTSHGRDHGPLSSSTFVRVYD